MNDSGPSLGSYALRSTAMVALLVFGSFSALWLHVEFEAYRREADAVRRRTVALHEMHVRTQVEQVVASLAYRRDVMIRQLEAKLESRVERALASIDSLRRELDGKISAEAIQKVCTELLASLRSEEGRGYFFIHDRTGRTLLYPPDRAEEGRDGTVDLPPTSRAKVIELFRRTLSEGRATGRYRWPRPGGSTDEMKIAHCRLYEPYAWVVGTGAYLADHEEEVKRSALDYISRIRFGQQGYVFVDRADGVVLWNPDEASIGRNRWTMGDPEGLKVAQGVKQALDMPQGSFIEYRWQKPGGGGKTRKLSFVKAFREWMWVVGAGVYLDEIDSAVAEMRRDLKTRLFWRLLGLVLFLLLVGALLVVGLRRFTAKILGGLERFDGFFASAVEELRPLEPETLPFRELRQLAHRANEMVEKRREADRALYEADARRRDLERLVNRSPVVAIRLRLDGSWTIDEVSRNATRLDWDPDELVAAERSFLDLVADGEREDLGKKLHALVDGKGELLARTVFLREGGARSRWIDLWCWAAREDGGEPRIEGVLIEVSDRVHLERRLREGERLQAMGQLAGGIAHDFNNQLAAILGYADILSAQLDDPVLKSHADFIIRGAQRSADLTRQLLAYTRKGKNLSTHVDLHELLERTLSLVEHGFDRRLRIERRFAAREAFTRGDPSLLQNAFMNLVMNAWEAMDGEGSLVVETADVTIGRIDGEDGAGELDPGSYVRISFIDSGRGMDGATMARAFEPFFTTKDDGEGAGLGLAAVWGTATAHGGSVGIRSEPGRGTTVLVHLPRIAGDPVERSEGGAGPTKAGARILVVDDEDLVLQMAGTMLSHLGHHVTLCATEEEALELFRHGWAEVDLVLLDMVMPGMGGRELHRRMKAIHPGLRCILASGYGLNDEAQAIMDEGVQAFVQKPYRMKALSVKVAEVLGTQG